MGKDNNQNNPATEPITEPATGQNDNKFLNHIPTKDDEILKKLDEVNKKLESFEILEEKDEDEEKNNKKDLGLEIAFITLIIVTAAFFGFKKEIKNSNE